MNNQFGLGVSNPTSLLVNQDFFAEIRLPYSVKRGEIFPLNVTVFNNIDVELPIRVKLITSEEEVQSDESEFDICIGPNDNTVGMGWWIFQSKFYSKILLAAQFIGSEL